MSAGPAHEPTPGTLEINLSLPLDRFDLTVDETFCGAAAILGPSGAGKTSLLEALAGLRRASGRVAFAGQEWQNDSMFLAPERRSVGYVPQDALLMPHLSVRANLGFAQPVREVTDGGSLADVVRHLGLEPLLDRSPRHLSGGERRRVALVRALGRRASLLLLDEPTEGLDPVMSRLVVGVLRRLARSGQAMVVVTHRQDVAEAVTERILRLDRGRVVTDSEATGLRGDEVLLPGRVEAHEQDDGITRIALEPAGGSEPQEVRIPLHSDLEPGDEVVIAIPARDLMVSIVEPSGLSARNVQPAVVDALVPNAASDEGAGSPAVDLTAGHWRARLTHSAVRELDLAPGREVWLVSKSHSWRVVSS